MRVPETSTIWTVGHSNRDLETFIELLTTNEIALLADVRRFPGSKRQPQFGQDSLRQRLAEDGIEYRHFAELGGRRRERLPESPNKAWRVESFNAYADHMQTPGFLQALGDLETAAHQHRTVLMCAEALPWRCHRRLIADALVARGWTILDILGRGQCREHSLPEFARISRERVTYPGVGQ